MTTFLAGAALVLATYLVLDRVGMFKAAPSKQPRQETPRGPLGDWEQTAVKVFQENSPSVVYITTARTLRSLREVQTEATGTGTGFIWDAQGHIVTNYHVIRSVVERRESLIVRLANKKVYDARYIHGYPYLDVAVIRLVEPPPELRPIPIGRSADLRVGQAVFAIGNPFGLDQTLSTGVIGALDREIQTSSYEELTSLIQVDAAINPGNSGGPLLDSAGRLIGMNTAILSRTGQSAGIGFAVPIDVINAKMPRLLQGLLPLDAGLGIRAYNGEPIPLQVQERLVYGVRIKDVTQNGGAARAGIRPWVQVGPQHYTGDAILRVNDEDVDSITDIHRILDRHKAGDQVTVTLARFGNSYTFNIETVKVTLQALKAD